jgi:hypothetical protein
MCLHRTTAICEYQLKTEHTNSRQNEPCNTNENWWQWGKADRQEATEEQMDGKEYVFILLLT